MMDTRTALLFSYVRLEVRYSEHQRDIRDAGVVCTPKRDEDLLSGLA